MNILQHKLIKNLSIFFLQVIKNSVYGIPVFNSVIVILVPMGHLNSHVVDILSKTKPRLEIHGHHGLTVQKIAVRDYSLEVTLYVVI